MIAENTDHGHTFLFFPGYLLIPSDLQVGATPHDHS